MAGSCWGRFCGEMTKASLRLSLTLSVVITLLMLQSYLAAASQSVTLAVIEENPTP